MPSPHPAKQDSPTEAKNPLRMLNNFRKNGGCGRNRHAM